MKLPLYIVLFLFGLVIAQTAYFYPSLPDTVGSHFDGIGKVNGTSSKLGYFAVYFVSLAITSSFTLLLPLIFKYLPTAIINLPHREYWLSGDRREESLKFLNVHFSWFGVATMLMIIIIFHLTFLANLNPVKDISAPIFWALLCTFFLFVIWWTVLLIRRFHSPS